MNYVTIEKFDAIVAESQARCQSARLKRFAGKKERTYTVTVICCDPMLGVGPEKQMTIRGFTLADAKEQAGIR